jgi:hypothetical protein
MEGKQMKVLITKYALSEGVFYGDAERVSDSSEMIVVFSDKIGRGYFHGEGNEWHKTQESAIEKAESMRVKKIASLKRQIEKLEKLSFK